MSARHHHSNAMAGVRALAEQAFSRAAGASVVEGNRVRLLRDATENYPAWLEAISAARRHVHFENYIVHDDEAGEMFARALVERALAGVRVRVIYDWLGCVKTASRGFWDRLRAAGVEVRAHEPPRFEAPLAWLSRDHRKMVAVDGEVAFVAGLCVGKAWLGDPAAGIPPWRDTGVELRGPAVADVERAFAEIWSRHGAPIPADEIPAPEAIEPAGGMSVRIVASEPATTGMLRLDQLVAAFARQRLWLTDAYYLGTSSHVQALTTAARAGVDVRLLLPGTSDIPLARHLSRAGYRTLLDAGVRIFEWNGPMLHAKTAVADGKWARVGSTNLNLASWLGNWELDAVIEDESFGREMEAAYEEDLAGSTEVVLTERRRVRAPGRPPRAPSASRRGRGSAGRAAAGAVRIGHTLGAAMTSRRTLEPVETRMMLALAVFLLLSSAVAILVPRIFAFPAALVLGWLGLASLYRAWQLHQRSRSDARPQGADESAAASRREERSSLP